MRTDEVFGTWPYQDRAVINNRPARAQTERAALGHLTAAQRRRVAWERERQKAVAHLGFDPTRRRPQRYW